MHFLIHNKINIFLILLLISVMTIMCSNHEENDTLFYNELFSGPISMGKIENKEVDEASGLAVSRINENMLWTHNDSGDDSRVFLFTDSGKHVGEFYLKDIELRDAEDIAVGPGPETNVSYIYLGDIGDNWGSEDVKQIYRFPEPKVGNQKGPIKDTIANYDVINFTYPDGPRDAETLMVDPTTKDIYIISKREVNVGLYKLPYPYPTNDTLTLEKLGNFPHTMIVGGDISADGKEVLIKSYSEIFYYKLNEDEKIEGILNKEPVKLPYANEPQGEAIAWANDSMGYYTLSEEVLLIPATLYFYEKK